jgi:hypothetical protein
MQASDVGGVSVCSVCGSREVQIDAVEHRGWLGLGQCARCDHRWTQPLREAPVAVRALARVGAHARPEVASAA